MRSATRRSRNRAFLSPARGALAPLKEGQTRCPMCLKGMGMNKHGGLAGHKSNGFPCAGPSIYKLAQEQESVYGSEQQEGTSNVV